MAIIQTYLVDHKKLKMRTSFLKTIAATIRFEVIAAVWMSFGPNLVLKIDFITAKTKSIVVIAIAEKWYLCLD